MDEDQSTFMYGVYETQAQIDEWKDDSKMLEALMQAGVDNWDGYELALEIYDSFK